MRRIGSSDSAADEQIPRNGLLCNFPPLMEVLDDEAHLEEHCRMAEKKRRLSVDQVKALERTFEVENKLEAERKVKLAQDLGLQPRQIAVWFQNRRARWKTKQLERDYGVLKANYEALMADFQTLVRDNDVIRNEVNELKGKLQEKNSDGYFSAKEEMDPSMAENTINGPGESLKNTCNGGGGGDNGGAEAPFFPDSFIDRPSDSDSSAILNEDRSSPNAAISSPENLHDNHLLPPSPFKCHALPSSSPASAVDCYGQLQKSFSAPQQLVKLEERDFFNGDEACNFFSDEQAPTLPWCCSDQWR